MLHIDVCISPKCAAIQGRTQAIKQTSGDMVLTCSFYHVVAEFLLIIYNNMNEVKLLINIHAIPVIWVARLPEIRCLSSSDHCLINKELQQ